MAYTIAETMRGKVAGETDDEFRRYKTLVQGTEARKQATAQGLDTSGQFWTGDRFKPMDSGFEKWMADHWPIVAGGIIGAPLALGAFGALGAGGGAGAGAGGGVSAGAGAGSGAGGAGMLGGFRLGDLIKGGTDLTSMLLGNLGQNRSLKANETAAREALAFAKQQYDEQNALEQARYNAYESRRGPVRKASSDSLIALKQLIGLPR